MSKDKEQQCPNCGYDGSAFGPIRKTMEDNNNIYYGCVNCNRFWIEKKENTMSKDKIKAYDCICRGHCNLEDIDKCNNECPHLTTTNEREIT